MHGLINILQLLVSIEGIDLWVRLHTQLLYLLSFFLINFPPIGLIYGPLVMFNQDIILFTYFGPPSTAQNSLR